jgi:hypothetical protein
VPGQWATEGKPVTAVTRATAVSPETALAPITAMIPATTWTVEAAGTPAAANEFCGDFRKNSSNRKTHSAFTQYRLKLILLILSNVSIR